ncbi:hypothetical protein [Chitinophaga sp. Cy-1792]|uniref:WD40/YVTN/BNR-like repeat-containing protein n=1 Tax=Chitinophaga sp. Cy-1792 TaxID=2608339 RepID=UPI00142401A5|nr:hypothetical protein [Chitinophaga sp. Cy-1792]NIG52052.1 hypothetical protein [Chitinophaga sp. Cy-1792]
MNRVMVFFLLLLPGISRVAAQVQHPVYTFKSSARTLNVATNGSMLITTKAGELAYADSIAGLWSNRSPQGDDKKDYGWLLERTNIFNRDTAFTSGFINNNSKYDVIYRTENGGKSWTVVYFGADGWIDGAASLSDGRALMSIAGKGVAHSSDYGKTWEIVPAPYKQQRYSEMFYNSRGEGIMASVWNSIAFTADDGRTWKALPTPLDQKKYNKTNPNGRPNIDAVAIFRNYFLVKEEGMVFVSEKDSLSWKYEKDIQSFYSDPEHDGLFLQLKDQSVLHINERMDTAKVGKINSNVYSAACSNDRLFLLVDGAIVRMSANESAKVFPVWMDGEVTKDPVAFAVRAGGGYYGLSGKNIYSSTAPSGQWKLVRELPVAPDVNTVSFDQSRNEVAFQTSNDSIYHVNLDNGNTRTELLGGYLVNFQKHSVKRVVISVGSQGCFHSFSDNLEYEKDGNDFVLADNVSKGTRHTNDQKTDVEIINANDVDRLVKAICNDNGAMPGIADIKFTQKEYAQCKKDISEFNRKRDYSEKRGAATFYMEENNLDFAKLISLVDSIATLDDATLGKTIMRGAEGWSTTTNWTAITLVNDAGEMITIQHAYYEAPNAMFLPCRLSFNGEGIVSTTPEIARFLYQNCPSLIKEKSRMQLMHNIVKDLYNRKTE